MGRPRKRFCTKGHDKDVVGRTKGDSGNCNLCQLEYRKEHEEIIREQGKIWRKENKRYKQEMDKEYATDNQDKISAWFAQYYQQHKDLIKTRTKLRQKEHKEQLQLYNKEYWKDEKKCQSRRERQAMRRKTDPLFKLRERISGRLLEVLKSRGWKKTTRLSQSVGCTVQQLRIHLEKQFTKGMSWDNHSLPGWHIDHIVPLDSAKTVEELYSLCHYTNLQPLWALDNIRKGNKLI